MSEATPDHYIIEVRSAESPEPSLLLTQAELSDEEVRVLVDIVQEFLDCRPRPWQRPDRNDDARRPPCQP